MIQVLAGVPRRPGTTSVAALGAVELSQDSSVGLVVEVGEQVEGPGDPAEFGDGPAQRVGGPPPPCRTRSIWPARRDLRRSRSDAQLRRADNRSFVVLSAVKAPLQGDVLDPQVLRRSPVTPASSSAVSSQPKVLRLVRV